MKYLFSLILLLTILNTGLAADPTPQPFSGLDMLMTPEEYQQAGLDKLSGPEREALDAWLRRYTSGTVERIAEDVKVAVEAEVLAKEEAEAAAQRGFRSQIEGEFTGWTGKTTFRLKNGQVWKQRLEGQYTTLLQDPEVEFSRTYFGFYNMKVLATGKKIGVVRAE